MKGDCNPYGCGASYNQDLDSLPSNFSQMKENFSQYLYLLKDTAICVCLSFTAQLNPPMHVCRIEKGDRHV